jgi:peptide/nickel transport system substrate-binding protein
MNEITARGGRRRRRSLLALVLALSLLGAACGGGDDDSSSAPSGEDGGGGSTEPSGVFRWGADLALSRWDPHKATLGQDVVWLFPVYDRLVHLDPEGEPIPGLAESWEFNDDGTILTMKIRPDVTFHDGEPLDAEAVKANIERAKTLEDSSVMGDLITVDTVEVVDDLTVALNLSQPDAALPLRLSDRAGMMVSPAAFDSDLDTQPVGAGMFELTDYVEGDKATLQAYDGYWDPDAVKVEGMEIYAIPDPVTRYSALSDGQLDATVVAAADASTAEDQGFTVTPYESLEVWYLGLNSSKGDLGTIEARQAIMRAIDRDAIIDAVWFGLGNPAVQMFPEGYFATDPDTTEDDWGYDPDAARELLDEAGVPDGFPLEIIVPGPGPVATAEAVASQLGEVGIDATLRQVDPTEASALFNTNQEGDAIIGPWSGRPDPTQVTGTLYIADGFFNVSGESTPDLERLHTEGLSTFDPDERAGILQDLSAEMTRSAFQIPLFFPQKPLATAEGVDGLVPYSGKQEFRGVSVSG